MIILFLTISLSFSQSAQIGNFPSPIQLSTDSQNHEFNIFHLEKSSHVVVAEGRGYFPVLNRLGTELFAIFRSGAGFYGQQGYLEFAASFDSGQIWHRETYGEDDIQTEPDPIVVVNGPHDDRNPAVGFTQTGRIICAYLEDACYNSDGNYDPSLNQKEAKIVYSEDFGLNWTQPKPLGIEGMESCTPYGRIHQLDDGSLLMNLYGPFTEGIPKSDTVRRKANQYSYLVRSTDDGETWGDPALIASGHTQTAIFLMEKKRMLAVSTSEYVKRLDLLRSDDNGYTWTRPMRLTKPNQHTPDLIRLSNGWLALFFADTGKEYNQIVGVVSKDEGITWELQNRCTFSRPVKGKIGHPSAVRLPDGRVAVMYYWDGEAKNQYDGTRARLYVNFFNETEWLNAYNKTF